MPFITQGKTNWKFLLIVVILTVIAGGGILVYSKNINKQIISFSKTPEIKTPDLTIESIKNTEYHVISYNKTIQLKNGSYFQQYPDSTSSLSTKIYNDKVVFSDLNNDGKKDAAVVLSNTGGGSGDFRELAIILNKDGKPSYLASKELGDRVIINSINIESGIIILDMIVHGQNDALCCPTLNKIVKYQLSENQLIEVKDGTADASASSIQDWQTYTNEECGFEVKYPKEWYAGSFFPGRQENIPEQEKATSIDFFTPDQNPFRERGEITIYVSPAANTIFCPVTKGDVSCIDGQDNEMIVDNVRGITRKGKTTEYCPPEGREIKELYLCKSNNYFRFSTTIQQEKIFDQMLSTFRFLK